MNLVAVQAKMSLEDYQSSESFKRRILKLTEQAVAGLPDAPTLVAFPELIGMPLLLSAAKVALSPKQKVQDAFIAVVRNHWQAILRDAWRYRVFGRAALYLPFALAAYQTYRDAFAEAARTFAVTIVAGSSFLPHIEEEPSRGLHIADPRVFNTALSFAATGVILGRSRKVYLTAGAESAAGLSRGRWQDLQPFRTDLGKVGVAICLDGFYSAVLEQFDGLGAQIVVQPSANHADWQRPWPPDLRISEADAWMRYGLRHMIQQRQTIRYGVNPMMVGEMWDLQAQGRSSIVANRRFMPDVSLDGWPSLLAIAPDATEEAFVRAVGLVC